MNNRRLNEQMRTIFSCMWPSCPRNCDSLDDIERHVRAHLGPNSIGDEDFYYEEMEVDEPTYLAIFERSAQQQLELELQMAERRLNLASHHHRHRRHTSNHHNHHHHHHQQALPLSPSHNSDGLSSGHSFASSSPATSPVCSADSSSASSSSALSTSSLSSSASSAGFHLEPLTGGAGSGRASGANKMQAAALSGGQLSASGGAGNSLEWSHGFLASSPSSAASWLPRRAEQLISKRHKQQVAAHFSNLQQQQQQQLCFSAASSRQRAAFSLDAMLLTPSSPKLARGGARRHHQAHLRQAAKQAEGGSSRGRKRAQQLQEQLRASIIEQLNQQRQRSAAQHNLQFSMQLSGSSPASHARAAYSTTTNDCKATSGHLDDHSYELGGGNAEQRSSADNSSSLATQIKSRRGRRPSAKLQAAQQEGHLQKRASGALAQAPKKRGRKPQIFHQQNPHSQAALASQASSPSATAKAIASSLSHHQSCRNMAPTPPLSSATMTPSGAEDEQEDEVEDEQDEELENDEIGGGLRVATGGGSLSGQSRRARNENRKCRKVYGMEAREQWCIQCKWKKACSRFCDQLQ